MPPEETRIPKGNEPRTVSHDIAGGNNLPEYENQPQSNAVPFVANSAPGGNSAPNPVNSKTVLQMQQTSGNASVIHMLQRSKYHSLATTPKVQRDSPTTPPGGTSGGTGAPAAAPGVKVDSYTLSFTLPKGATVVEGWNDVYTEDYTTVRVTLKKSGLSVSFGPPLIADLQWPVSDRELSSGSRDAKSGDISVSTYATQTLGIDALGGTVDGKFKQWIRDAVTGTPLGITPYDYDADPTPIDTLQQIVGNMKSGGGGGGVSDKDIKNIQLETHLTFAAPITKQTKDGGGRISGTATATIYFSGAADKVSKASERSIDRIKLEGSDIVMISGGEDAVKVGTLWLEHGGGVSVLNLTVLHKAGGVESFFRLLAMMLDPQSEALLQAGIITPEMAAGLEPALVKKMAQEKIEAALGPAIRDAIRANCLVVPDVDLCKMLGI